MAHFNKAFSEGTESDKEKGYHVQNNENCDKYKSKIYEFAEVTVVTEVKMIYFQDDLVGQALAWCLQLAAERLWKPDPLAPSGLNLLLLNVLLLLLPYIFRWTKSLKKVQKKGL